MVSPKHIILKCQDSLPGNTCSLELPHPGMNRHMLMGVLAIQTQSPYISADYCKHFHCGHLNFHGYTLLVCLISKIQSHVLAAVINFSDLFTIIVRKNLLIKGIIWQNNITNPESIRYFVIISIVYNESNTSIFFNSVCHLSTQYCSLWTYFYFITGFFRLENQRSIKKFDYPTNFYKAAM